MRARSLTAHCDRVDRVDRVDKLYRPPSVARERKRFDRMFMITESVVPYIAGIDEWEAWRLTMRGDVLSFLDQGLLPESARYGPDAPAGGTLTNWVPSLRFAFSQRFADTPRWHPENGGDPFSSRYVADHIEICKREQMVAGAHPRSAVPLIGAEVEWLLDCLEAELVKLTVAEGELAGLPLERAGNDFDSVLLLARDATSPCSSPCSGMRSAIAAGATCSCSRGSTCTSDDGVLNRALRDAPGAGSAPGEALLLGPETNTVCTTRRPPTIVAGALSAGVRPQNCPVVQPKRLDKVLLASSYDTHRYGFPDIGSAARHLWLQNDKAVARLKGHLKAMGVHEAETLHSFRRRAAQALEQAGASRMAICERLGSGDVV